MSTAASSLPDFTGCTIEEHYKLSEVIGSGSFGVVYKALDTREASDSPSRHRAVKIISKAGRTPAQLDIIRREVALHSIVAAHANIITIHDAFDDDEHFYLILDYCPGGDLFSYITEGVYWGKDGEELARSAFLSLVDGMQHCHEHKIAHRDLKPENILASKDGSKVFLADFGLATRERMIKEHGSGTALYMAPECHGRLNGFQPYDTRAADVWALGIILVNMLTGRNPWEQASMRDAHFADFLGEKADFFRESFPQLSKGVCEVLAEVLEFRPERRMSLRKLREAVVSLESFFCNEGEEESVTDTTTTITTATTDESFESLDTSDGPPTLSSDGDEDEDESPLVTPAGTNSAKPKNMETEKVDWKTGSTAQLLMARHRLEEQFGNGFY
ncbi:Pkinase-domain-containing protein [Lentinus tigrinus ALCF2SS1-7]|uniref:Pkinase-domain-containing protein n=1 Tax=Lentinus tigrinus ALCF2SS1-6 TaxID=1328759 RepID=A0A5C2S9Z8_9APHY|nr:Pkinase-domain-containing protein [Lentinus tigrinus ALCF2SS1-6]RPD74801.1 Pkinase-domain-containing protein [Lentinus tigrinus ALCF2SS1-7]